MLLHLRASRIRFPLGALIFACSLRSAKAQSFEGLFTSSTYYALAIAGISLGSAIVVALLALLIFCLVRRRIRLSRKPKQLDTEASSSAYGQQQQLKPSPRPQPQSRQQRPAPAKLPHTSPPAESSSASRFGGGGGGIALPMAVPPAGNPAASGGSSNNGSSGPAMAKYVNPAFDGRMSGSGSQGSGAGAVGLYRNTSALRPVSYASLESSSKSHGNGAADLPVISHALAHTAPAPAQPLDPRHFLSQGALNLTGPADHLKRMSYAEPPQQQQGEVSQHPGGKLEKRLSYAEKRAQVGSSLELSSGQVFFASSLQRLHQQQQQQQLQPQTVASLPRTLLQPTTLATQHEESTSSNGRAAGVDTRRQLQPHLEEGPSFPRTRSPSPKPPLPPQPQPPPPPPPNPQKLAAKAPGASLPLSSNEPPRNPRNLHRFQLGGGVGGDDGDVDRRSVTSTVLKQEAIQAFEFLDNYEDEN